ncbi:MAG: hypothetical protein GX127_01300 [Eubacteriaceae bacterium]|nr:hypothetical protein [Eubacteriaceae bacterium]
MQVFNKDHPLFNDFKEEIKNGGKLSIAAASFSIYAFERLKKELSNIESFRFIYTEPTFTQLDARKERREFYIPGIKGEKAIHGTEFEMKLRNELTQKAIARECAQWIADKALFRSNITKRGMNNYMVLETGKETYVYQSFDGFTLSGLMAEKDNSLNKFAVKIDNPENINYLNAFEEIWQDNNISKEHSK